jgi:hypothetical protein
MEKESRSVCVYGEAEQVCLCLWRRIAGLSVSIEKDSRSVCVYGEGEQVCLCLWQGDQAELIHMMK